jgi:molecular chaperone HtpG
MATVKMGLQLLETLTSALYDNPIIFFREYVQNSVDAYNRAISENSKLSLHDFHVDINIDKNGRNIFIEDNGYGIQPDKFQDTMTSIGASDKVKHTNQIGFRGIGRLSAMPFCKKLIFKNKPQGSDKIFIYTWNGAKFNEMLRQGTEQELSEAIEVISSLTAESCKGQKDKHFFKVEIFGYDDEIADLVSQDNFVEKLKMILPLQYSPELKESKVITDKYCEYMGYPLDRYSFIIRLDNTPLYKPYQSSHILEAGIHFWELRYPSNSKGEPGEKLGLLWYTFNRKMTANPKDSPYGILVRSKNMLVGDHNALATALFRAKSDNQGYVATYRELTQTLQGVYGEMLIDTPKLQDNARRDWFKFDTASMQLRDIIFDFMKRLYAYRSIASKAFNAIENDKNKQKLMDVFSDLTSDYKPQKFVASFYDAKRKADESKKGDAFEFADEDIPRFPITIKRFYEKLVKSIREYFVTKDNMQDFIKLRSYIKKKITQDSAK